jgi:plasmid maintenance system antidote protein VapI
LKTRDPNARKELLKKEQRITSNFSFKIAKEFGNVSSILKNYAFSSSSKMVTHFLQAMAHSLQKTE